MNEQNIEEVYQTLAREYHLQMIWDDEHNMYAIRHPQIGGDHVLLLLPSSLDSKSSARISVSYSHHDRAPEGIIYCLEHLVHVRNELEKKGYTPSWVADETSFEYCVTQDVSHTADVEKLLKNFRGLDIDPEKTEFILETMLRGFTQYVDENSPAYSATEHVMLPSYTAEQIEQFCLAIGEVDFQEEDYLFGQYAGNYISALISRCVDDDILIPVGHLDEHEPLSNLGYGNKNKTITVQGNAGYYIGDNMTGGEIYINDDYESISVNIKGGNVYHKGKAIVKDGKRLEKGRVS